jgi:hypothetical protein
MSKIPALLLLAVLCGCGDSGTTPAAPTPAPAPQPTPTPTPTPTPAPTPAPAAPPSVSVLVLNPPSIGSQSRSEGTVTLTGPAPEGGAVVGIASTNRDAVKVPATITIAEGLTSGTFFAESSTVGTPTAVSIVASYGGTSNGATLNVGPQPLRAVIRLNTRNNYPCGISSTGAIAQYRDAWPCDFNANESTGNPVLFRWFIRSSVRKEDWETKSDITFGMSTCELFRGHPQTAPGFTQVEVGLEVEDQRGNRSGFTTTTMRLETKRSCGYPD